MFALAPQKAPYPPTGRGKLILTGPPFSQYLHTPWKGKERKGKERKGKERKGKKRKEKKRKEKKDDPEAWRSAAPPAPMGWWPDGQHMPAESQL